MAVLECMDRNCIVHVTAELSTIFHYIFPCCIHFRCVGRPCLQLVKASPRPMPASLEFCYSLLTLIMPELVSSDNSNFIQFNQGYGAVGDY